MRKELVWIVGIMLIMTPMLVFGAEDRILNILENYRFVMRQTQAATCDTSLSRAELYQNKIPPYTIIRLLTWDNEIYVNINESSSKTSYYFMKIFENDKDFNELDHTAWDNKLKEKSKNNLYRFLHKLPTDCKPAPTRIFI